MLIGSFVPFQTASRAMAASMANITVTGNNIANANTENYTRQKVDMSAISSSITTQYTTGQETVGYGVSVDGISQYRDTFLDTRYRDQNSESSQYTTFLDGLNETLSVIDEAETDGLMAQFSDFLSQLQTFSQSSTSSDIALVVRTSAESLTAMMNVYSDQITQVRDQAISDLSDVVVDNSFNAVVKSIAELNKSIREEEIGGESPNELYDARNALIDKLSSMANIKVTYTNEDVGSGKTVDNLSISIINTSTSDTLEVIDGSNYNTLSVVESDETYGAVSIIANSSFGGNDGDDVTGYFSSGSIKGYLDLINGEGTFADTATDENEASGTLYYLQSLDTLAANFAYTFNELNVETAGTAKDLFSADNGGTTITAANIQVSDAWLDDATYITTSTTGSDSGDNILQMIDAMESDVTFRADPSDSTSTVIFEGTFTGYMSALVGELSLSVELNQNFSNTADSVLSTLSDDRESLSGVTLDEEGVNLIVYQKAYEAAARYFTALDEALDTVINRMGRVGL